MSEEKVREVRRTLNELYWFNFKFSLLHKIMGLDFSRCFEYTTVLNELKIHGGEEILDIGGYWSCFPLFMAKKGARVTVLDIDKRAQLQKKYARRVGLQHLLNDKSFKVIMQDARRMEFPDSSFDFVTCVSVIEHIPRDGDIETMKEIERVLRPGGRVFISVPYKQKYVEGRWGRWFQRYYDYDHLHERLIAPSALDIKSIGFLIDRNTRKFSGFLYYKIPRLLRHSSGWSQILFAKHFLLYDKANREDAWVAWLVLEKTTWEETK